MGPDITNYESWIIDYLDGNLTPEQAEMLMSFLSSHPDLKEELSGLQEISMKPSGIIFSGKNLLHRSVSEISDSQFDLLCAAELENDLDEEQKREFQEIIAEDRTKRQVAEIFSRTRLVTPQVKYLHKNRLRKTTAWQKTYRIGIISMGAAAAVLFLFLLFHTEEIKDNPVLAGNDSSLLKNAQPRIPVIRNQADMIVPVKKNDLVNTLQTDRQLIAQTETKPEKIIVPENTGSGDTLTGTLVPERNSIEPVRAKTDISVTSRDEDLSLVAINTSPMLPDYSDAETGAGNFLARFVREKILKNDQEKGRLKAFEIADAGITGINWLVGSNMSLKKTYDEKGQVKSVYFSSSLIKFNAPVKKTEPAE